MPKRKSSKKAEIVVTDETPEGEPVEFAAHGSTRNGDRMPPSLAEHYADLLQDNPYRGHAFG
jgi:hypothetical protein